ncbi:MAG: hypothetical protein M1120_03925 [Patescibacteria group bacterium]|nr:hypothetical protein [Patescibacteria group bacterium]
MKKILFLSVFITVLITILVYKIPSAEAGCRCPGPNCDHCSGGPQVIWDKRDQPTCDSFTDWDSNSGNCSGGGPAPTPAGQCYNCSEQCTNWNEVCGGWGKCHQGDICLNTGWVCNWGDCPAPAPPPLPPCDANDWGVWSACSKQCDDGSGPGSQSRTNACGTTQTQNCNTMSCYIPYTSPTPTPLPSNLTPTPTPPGYTPTPTPSVSPHGYFPGWFKTENGDVHSNYDIIVSLPTILERFATYLVTTANLSSFAAGSASDARPELASVNKWYWYSPPYGTVSFPENAGFYAYYSHNKPARQIITSDGLTNSSINSLTADNSVSRVQINPTAGAVSINESVSLSGSKMAIFYINGDLNINNNINLADNSGIVFIVSGSLNISPQVTEADGFYLVDKTVNTTDGSGAGGPLVIKGAVFVSQNGRIFGSSREIHDYATPSEKIIYEPKYLVEFSQGLGRAGITWREVAP